MAEKNTEKAPAFPVAELIANSNTVLGVAPEIATGALHGCEALTIEVAAAKVKLYLARPIKQ